MSGSRATVTNSQVGVTAPANIAKLTGIVVAFGEWEILALAKQIRRQRDLDNFLKAALDAITGIVIVDDALVAELDVRKRYSITPKMVLTVVPLTSLPANRRAAS